ncbi:PREDICTED: syntaxin-4 isoform X1 [Hipposideros armiger]|uniref:Syntaxin-4 isoform X1 n=1 Tax=Hipposideros armiger TaxID=186990 RepID=A0A8B7Q602_HIPAR|nr:PREDICTED: syntaxin-4 isoform X1 [Hipposideros armiger]
MRDRTHELRQGDDSSDEEDKERVALVVHPGTARLGSPDDEFFQKVRTIRQAIVKLENKVRELEKQQVTILATPLPEESMKQDLQNLRDEIKQLGREIRGQLKAIEPQKEEADENYNSVNTRMRKTQHGVLSQQFVELINKCNSMQSEYREKNVERIRRQLKITNAGMVSDEELEQMLDSGQSEVFVSNILKDTQVTRQALNEISARHSEIQQLERSIRELHEIFTFLATEVEMQGEMINRIEKNILSSADYVERGQEHVKIALENQKKARKALRAAGTQGLPSLPAAGAVGAQDKASSRTPFLTLVMCRGTDGSSGVGSHLFTGSPPWATMPGEGRMDYSVLFCWDTWFCKKIKKKRLETPLCMCAPGRAGPGPAGVVSPPLGHSWGEAQPRQAHIRLF